MESDRKRDSDPPGGTSQRQQLPTTTRVKGSRYTHEQREMGLRAVALNSGNTERAARDLRTMGIKVPRSTLRDWATRQHVQRYREIQTEVIPEIEERLAQKSEGLATQYSDLEADVLVRLKKELPNVPVRDLSRAARDLATGKGISTDKARDLRGRGEPARPNPIEEYAEAVRDLERLGITIQVGPPPKEVPNLEGKATEEKDFED